MSSQPTVARRIPGRSRPLVVAALATLLAAGCAGGTSPASQGPSAAAPSVAVSPPAVESPPTPEPSAAPSAAAVPLPSDPPVAMLASPGGVPGAGALGGYTWGQAGSDAPWIVPRARDAIAGTGPWDVAFDPPLEAATWRATWYPIDDGSRGPLAGMAEGTGAIAFEGPADSGPWSLRLEAVFGSAGRATWYWRLAP